MGFKLHEQALDYLNDVEKALLLPHGCPSNHKEIREIIKRLKDSDSTINNPEKEFYKMLGMLGRYAQPKQVCNIQTVDTFYELFHKLFNLSKPIQRI